jgi:hypothetical protein
MFRSYLHKAKSATWLLFKLATALINFILIVADRRAPITGGVSPAMIGKSPEDEPT